MKKIMAALSAFALVAIFMISGCQKQEGQKGGTAPSTAPSSAPTTSPTTT